MTHSKDCKKNIDWEQFRPTLNEAFDKENKGLGERPAFDRGMMFKILVLQSLYNLSDEQTEYQINDRLSFQRFLGLSLSNTVPAATTICLFRKKLAEKNLAEKLFNIFNKTLESEEIKAEFRTPQSSTELIEVDGGTFNREGYNVTVRSFKIGKYPVTQKLYKELMGKNPSHFKGENRPVECVCWYDAVEFCNALSKKDGLIPCYSGSAPSIKCDFKANVYRLPTEAEWEFAARGGNNLIFIIRILI